MSKCFYGGHSKCQWHYYGVDDDEVIKIYIKLFCKIVRKLDFYVICAMQNHKMRKAIKNYSNESGGGDGNFLLLQKCQISMWKNKRKVKAPQVNGENL